MTLLSDTQLSPGLNWMSWRRCADYVTFNELLGQVKGCLMYIPTAVHLIISFIYQISDCVFACE